MRALLVVLSKILRQLLLQNKKLKEIKNTMTQLSDEIAALKAAQQAQAAKLVELQATLTAEIQQIADKIAAGNVTQADLDNIRAVTNAITGDTATVGQLDTDIKNIVP